MKPSVDFRATLTDRDDTAVELTRVNVGGQVQLTGKLGRGNLRIPFGNIRAVEFRSESGDATLATVHLKSGEPVELTVRNSLTFYGQTAVGVYEVRARDLQHIEFH